MLPRNVLLVCSLSDDRFVAVSKEPAEDRTYCLQLRVATFSYPECVCLDAFVVPHTTSPAFEFFGQPFLSADGVRLFLPCHQTEGFFGMDARGVFYAVPRRPAPGQRLWTTHYDASLLQRSFSGRWAVPGIVSPSPAEPAQWDAMTVHGSCMYAASSYVEHEEEYWQGTVAARGPHISTVTRHTLMGVPSGVIVSAHRGRVQAMLVTVRSGALVLALAYDCTVSMYAAAAGVDCLLERHTFPSRVMSLMTCGGGMQALLHSVDRDNQLAEVTAATAESVVGMF